MPVPPPPLPAMDEDEAAVASVAAAAAPLADPSDALSLLADLSETSLGGPAPALTPVAEARDTFSSSNSMGPKCNNSQ